MNLLRVSAVVAALLVSGVGWSQPVVAPAPPSSLEEILGPLANDRLFRDSTVGMQIVDVATGEEVFARDADVPLIPASTMKVLTAAAALKTLGPAYRFQTGVYVDGPIESDVLRGNLYIKGHGDPTLVVERLWKVVNDLKLEGITRIEGDVVYDDTFFDRDFKLPGWDKKEDLEEGPSYFARSGALSLNFNTVALVVGPGAEVGSEGVLRLETPAGSYVTLENQVTTSAATGWPRLKIEREVTPVGITFRVIGSVPLGDGRRKFYRTVEDPTAHFVAAFTDLLDSQGLRVGGKHRLAPTPPSAKLLFTARSMPLAAILMDMNKFSNNFMAEQVIKVMAAEVSGAPGTTAKGVEVVREYLLSLGLPDESFTLVNGSGLSRASKMSPRVLTTVMVDMAHDPRVGHEFASSLAIAGQDGTLHQRLAADSGRMRGKTGTLDGAHCLTGYIEAADRRLYAFAFLVNDVRGSLSKVKTLQDRFTVQVFQVGGPPAPDAVDRGE